MDLSSKQGRREQGLRIQRTVERAGLSIEELAGRIGCSRALIYQYLAGSTLAQPDRLQQIAAECGVDLSYFYEDADPTSEGDTSVSAPGKQADSGVPAIDSLDVGARLHETLRALTELADAQEGPPAYRALAATCERIYFIAGQLGERAAQARVQFRLGNACLRTADYPRAAEALRSAIAIASEPGVDAGTIVSDARQSLGNVLVSIGNIPEARQQFAAIADGDNIDARWKGTLSLGSVHTMYGEYREAMERFDAAAAIIEDAEARGALSSRSAAIGLLYVNGNRTNVYLNGGDFEGARPLILKCLETAEAYGIADEHLEARFDLAWCDLNTGKWAAAYRGLNSMLQLARFVGDQARETMARAWLGILLASAGDFETAISHGKDALSMALSHGDRRGELYAQLALADAYTGQTKRESEARYHTNQALAVATSLRMDRGEAECRLRAARLSAQSGDYKEVAEAAARSRQLAEKLGARHLESLALCWLATAIAQDGSLVPAADGGASQLANSALSMAETIGLAEGKWRAHAILGSGANSGSRSGAETSVDSGEIMHFRASVEVLDGLRTELVESGLADTLLENEECLEIYAELIRRMRIAGDSVSADALLEQVGWLPLELRLSSEPAADQPPS